MPIENEIKDYLNDLQEWNRYTLTLETLRASSKHPERYNDLFEAIEEVKAANIKRLEDLQNGLF